MFVGQGVKVMTGVGMSGVPACPEGESKVGCDGAAEVAPGAPVTWPGRFTGWEASGRAVFVPGVETEPVYNQ